MNLVDYFIIHTVYSSVYILTESMYYAVTTLQYVLCMTKRLEM